MLPEYEFSKLAGFTCLNALRDFTDNIHEAVCAIDANGTVMIWNHNAEKLYHVAALDILGKRLTDFFPKALLETVRQNRKAQVNVPHHPQGKENTHILISATPWYVNGEFMGVVSTDRNYDEVVQLYAEIERARATIAHLQAEINQQNGAFTSLVGRAGNFQKRVRKAIQIAPTLANVMITGESGTGKEIFAKGIHDLSGRKGLFIPVNSSAIPSELFEAEFFGYDPGAFTGASSKGKFGYFELAAGGTLFLDEISEMPLPAQAKLLRALQEKEIIRVGGGSRIAVDVRIIAASNKNLVELIQQNEFREDFYYRLNVVEIHLPSLRERQQDIPLLIEHFLAEMAKKNNKKFLSVDAKAMALLCKHSWPGNVRELINVVENLVVTCQESIIREEHIPDYKLVNPGGCGNGASGYPLDLANATQTLEEENIRKALELCKYNKTKAARMLGIPRASLYNKMHDYGI